MVNRTINKDDIIQAAQAMSREERLNLIAEIAALVDEDETLHQEISDEELMRVAQEFIDHHRNLLRRLAE